MFDAWGPARAVSTVNVYRALPDNQNPAHRLSIEP